MLGIGACQSKFCFLGDKIGKAEKLEFENHTFPAAWVAFGRLV
jgi:hypothetical protein